jgi:hypothetical protein
MFAAALGVFFGLEVLDSDHFLGFFFFSVTSINIKPKPALASRLFHPSSKRDR